MALQLRSNEGFQEQFFSGFHVDSQQFVWCVFKFMGYVTADQAKYNWGNFINLGRWWPKNVFGVHMVWLIYSHIIESNQAQINCISQK